MPTLQEYLNEKYPTKEAKEKVKEIIANYREGLKIINQDETSHTLTREEVKELDGKKLNLSEYSNLEKVIIAGHYLKSKLTSLDISNCSKLIKLDCSENQITNLNIQGCSKLKELDYNNNPIVINEGLVYWWQKEIHPDFTKELIVEWEKKGFSYQNAKEWIKNGLKPSEINLASYGRYKNLDPKKEDWNLDQLREELRHANWQDWTDIHKDFGIKGIRSSVKIWQQVWEEKSLIYQDAQEWIKIDLEPKDCEVVKNWRKKGFTPQQVEEWIKVGWKHSEYEFIAYFQKLGYSLQTTFQEKNYAQHWLDKNYLQSQKKDITKLDISEKNLTSSLNLTDFINLEELNCRESELTNLTINNCPKLKKINCCKNNRLTSLDISTCEELIEFDCFENRLTNLFLPKKGNKLVIIRLYTNQLSDLTIFSHLVNLEILSLANNSPFGSLEPLQNLVKLKVLNIDNTNLDSGLEYLPVNLQSFSCRGSKLKEILEIYKGNWKAGREYYLQKMLKEEKAKIPTFEKEIQRLTSLIRSHKEKIIEAYTYFFAEKELLKELITAHLEYTKAKQEKQPAVKLKMQKEKLYNELMEKIGEESMEQVEAILYNCEELIHYETELQSQINQNQKLLENHQQVIQQITYNISNLNIHKGHGFIGNQAIEEVLETKINNTQVGNVNIENSQFASSVAIGVGQITNQQAQIQLPPKP